MYRRGKVWWVSYPGPDGQRVRESSGETDRRRAERFERQRREAVERGQWSPLVQGTAITLGAWAEKWLAAQRERKVRTIRDIETRTRKYVVPVLGARVLEDIKPKDVRKFVEGLGSTGLSPRSQNHVYDCLRGMMRDAVIEELIVATPCVLPPHTLPKKRDADPSWRAGAVFTRHELEQLITDSRIPADRRTNYALIALAGLRHGEAAGRRWCDYDPRAVPLGRLAVATQADGRRGVRELKTQNPRAVPVHPFLASVLAAWRSEGFPALFGRAPKPDDWIVPSRLGLARSVRHTHSKLHEDLERLGLRVRRTHDLRRTLITLARADGAPRDALQAVTHGPRGDVVDQYTSWPWPALCAAVACLHVGPEGGAG